MCVLMAPSLKHKSSAVIHVNKNSLLVIFVYVSRSIFICLFCQYHLYLLVSTSESADKFIKLKPNLNFAFNVTLTEGRARR